jgi:hypothetical protein
MPDVWRVRDGLSTCETHRFVDAGDGYRCAQPVIRCRVSLCSIPSYRDGFCIPI